MERQSPPPRATWIGHQLFVAERIVCAVLNVRERQAYNLRDAGRLPVPEKYQGARYYPFAPIVILWPAAQVDQLREAAGISLDDAARACEAYGRKMGARFESELEQGVNSRHEALEIPGGFSTRDLTGGLVAIGQPHLFCNLIAATLKAKIVRGRK